MCGIVGYVGKGDAVRVILGGLLKLEYRGYDSAGIAIYEQGKLSVTRAVGKLAELAKLFVTRPATAQASLGIGHTRWATHGKPSEDNAHPHTAGSVSLIHNGIIENYLDLKEELQRSGAVFRSETDTEIAAHLCNRLSERGLPPLEAMTEACKKIRGSYAFLMIDAKFPDRIVIAKNSSPIILGIGEGEMFVASDIPAILEHTRQMVILEDGDVAEVRADSFQIYHDGVVVKRAAQTITWDPVTAQKGGYKHFMLKEIFDQPQALTDTFRGRISQEEGLISLSELKMTAEDAKQIQRVVLLACGTAWHACLIAKFYIESIAGIPCEVDYASEFRYRAGVTGKSDLVVAVSQSGETADTLAALESAAKRGPTLAICNVLGSSLTRKVQHTLFTHAGPEISVASTKAFTTQLVAVYLLALYLAQSRGATTAPVARELMGALVSLPHTITEALRCSEQIRGIARKFQSARDFLFLGRGLLYPIALEGALKLKEISYIHAEGYPAGEMKHGPIALIDENMPVVVLLQRSNLMFEKTLSNLREVQARDGRIIAVTDSESTRELNGLVEEIVQIPFISDQMSPLIHTVPMQLLAYHVAVLNGTDVDLPRNLAKSVTVE
jgi:glucosamine--fructose-6-phosphate aminotransferase (isomerizing)